MLSSILNKKTCATCQICCVYDDTDVWDAPGFAKEEFDRNNIDGRFEWTERDGLYYLKMEKSEDGLYHCPCLTEHGCILREKKPFRCALWPLYVVRTEDGLGIAVSDVCPAVIQKDNESILKGIETKLPEIMDMVDKYPEQIEEFHDNYRMVAVQKNGTFGGV